MGWPQIKKIISADHFQQQQPPPPPPPLPKIETSGFSLNEKVSSNVFLIIIIFALIFFIFGLLHLLIRCLMRPPRTRDTDDELNDVTALEGQLQQLFHLHDSGIDQAYIDTFPVFNYKSIVGVKSPFDCAVCLSEFEPEDKLRLLPKCSHAFHMNCIDTWLLSHSTCPLCRTTLFPDIASNHYSSPVVLVLESGSESSREIGVVDRVNSHMSVCSDSDHEFGAPLYDIQLKDDENSEKIVQVKLGKFRNVDGEGCSENNVEQRRCFSMGSFAYVMDENSTLKVPITTPPLKDISKKKQPLTPGHRAAMSECGRDSRREFNELVAVRSIQESEGEVNISKGSKETVLDDNKAIRRSGKESFSISKIWLKGWKEKQNSTIEQSSRRAVSFRFPLQHNGVGGGVEDSKPRKGGGSGGGGGRRAISEVEVDRWENGGSEYSNDVEMQSCYSMDSQANHPSFARKTLLWLMGSNVSQNKVVHSSFSSDL